MSKKLPKRRPAVPLADQPFYPRGAAERFEREWSARLTVGEAKARYDAFLAQPDNTLAFDVTRPNPQPGRTLSAEVLLAVGDTILQFTQARLWHHWQTSGKPPLRMRITVTVEPDEAMPMEDGGAVIIDGSRGGRA